MSDRLKFIPVSGKEEKVLSYPHHEGYVYFASDSGKIYLDTRDKNKIPMGSNAGIFFGTKELTADEKEETSVIFSSSEIEGTQLPKIDDLILNNTDGSFYRVVKIIGENQFEADRLTVAGNGSGGGSGQVNKRGRVSISNIGEANILNGTPTKVSITVTSQIVDGEAVQEIIPVILSLKAKDNATGLYKEYKSEALTVYHGQSFEYDVSTLLRNSTETVITCAINTNGGAQGEYSISENSVTITTHELTISWDEVSFSSMSPFENQTVPVSAIISTSAARVCDIYFDDVLVYSETLSSSSTKAAIKYTINANSQVLKLNGESTGQNISSLMTHGAHKISAKLSLLNVDGSRGDGTEFITKEVALKVSNDMPLIWCGDFKDTYYEYDTIYIPFRVWDPSADIQIGVETHLSKGSEELPVRYITTETEWSSWEITNLSIDDNSYYTIRIGKDEKETRRTFTFTILKDPRNMKYVDDVVINWDSRGRSNTEGKIERETLKINNKSATFKNFNWYNNGWVFDENNVTCLRISNGAEVSFPTGLEKMDFYNTAQTSTIAHTIELQFKVKNISDYSKLITNYTRYKSTDGTWADNALYTPEDDKDSKYYNKTAFDAFKEQKATGYGNYDAFLAVYLRETKGTPSYDDLEYRDLTKEVDLSNVAIGFGEKNAEGTYINGVPGVYIGTQDAFFTNGNNTVNLDFVEDRLLNLAFVYTAGNPKEGGGNGLLEIYLNGILTSVIRSNSTNAWTVNSPTINFSAKNCDIDLYKIRVYNKGLSAQEVVQNYAFDLRDVKKWDQKDLIDFNYKINEPQFSYNAMDQYNQNHPLDPLMPYIILHTSSDYSEGRLPYNKEAADIVGYMEFVNPPLEAAYLNGSLSAEAEKLGVTVEEYYKHHCPSWTSPEGKVSFSVQGTSSQFYPRRNYKAKTKGNMYMNRGPFAIAYDDEATRESTKTDFFMDNNTVGTQKFTLKIDYMESSGNYNRGFANMVNTVYEKHPIEDYQKAFTNWDKYLNPDYEDSLKDYRTSVQGFPVLAFHQIDEENPYYIGKYNMLLDKGSDECYGFKPDKKMTHKFIKGTDGKELRVRDVAECWEFENNSRGFCSFRDPWDRKNLTFKAPVGADNEFTNKKAPIVADSFEYRYNVNKDLIDLLYTISTSNSEENQEALDTSFVNIFPGKVELTPKGIETEDVYKKETAGIFNEETEYFEEKKTEDETKYEPIALTAETYKADTYFVKEIKETVVSWNVINSNGDAVTLDNLSTSGQLLLDIYSNWERAVAWVWSTCVDAKIDIGNGVKQEVPSLYNYEEIELFEAVFDKTVHYVYTEDGSYQHPTADYDDSIVYYVEKTVNNEQTFVPIKLTNDASLVYAPGIYYNYNEANKIYILTDENEPFNSELIYYKATQGGHIDDFWKLETPIRYTAGGILHEYDTKEYRQEKFQRELSSHFDIDYLTIYFLMTEIFECYDSRGKNCMMASWGPQKEGGDYIWYPIFYDIDTQLGINNTGIPSFEYHIDATLDGSFSTNDSVLWNNFFTYNKGRIIEKYKQLMGKESAVYAPLPDSQRLFQRNSAGSKVDRVNDWYLSSPSVQKSFAVKGDRPLMAINCDEYYKYITPTNNMAEGTIYGRINEDGQYVVEDDTYFYALQGDRQLYREQFLSNRLEYIDSWLTLDHYERGGANRIRSRVSANNPKTTSDKWIEGFATNGASGLQTDSTYWKDEALRIKNHEFDGEYWINFTPIRNSYVTVGTDAANFPSLKYTGTPVEFVTTDLKNGVLQSGNYREQLYYIYGLNQMKSLGDLSKLYLQEFELSGNASKMTDLLLGYDALDESGNGYYNNQVNKWTIPAGKKPGMPLLKEVNLCNINFKEPATEDFSTCEKLENYRTLGSNITSTTFAEGVALNTLHLSEATVELSLTEARLLTKIVTDYEHPKKENEYANSKLIIPEKCKGLYIPNLTDKSPEEATTSITKLQLIGGNLGYHSYDLLEKYYGACTHGANVDTTRSVDLQNVQWAPFTLIENDEAVYNADYTYFKDTGHFTLEEYKNPTVQQWQADVRNKIIYLYDENINGLRKDDEGNVVNITNTLLLENLRDNNKFKGVAASSINPNITGIIYIENSETAKIKEQKIQEELANIYPNLKFFFKYVEEGFSAKYVIEDKKTGAITVLRTEKIQEFSEDKFFTNPDLVKDDKGTYLFTPSRLRDNMPGYNASGWAIKDENGNLQQIIKFTTVDPIDVDGIVKTQETVDNAWSSLKLDPSQKDYIFYAIFDNRRFVVRFYDGDGSKEKAKEYYINDGDIVFPPAINDFIPYKDDANLDKKKTYKFEGWSQSSTSLIVNTNFNTNGVPITAAKEFFPVFSEVSVYDNVLNEDYFKSIVTNTFDKGVFLSLMPGVTLKGKITIPVRYKDGIVCGLNDNAFLKQSEITHIFWAQEDADLERKWHFKNNCCAQMSKLKFFEMPTSANAIRIYEAAFNQTPLLFNYENSQTDLDAFFEKVVEIGGQAFSGHQFRDTLKFSNKLTIIERTAFSSFYSQLKAVQFGDSGKPSQLNSVPQDTSKIFNQNQILTSATIYLRKEDRSTWEIDYVSRLFPNPGNMTISYVEV